MTARQGFEPRLPGSEPGVLPLDDLASSGGPWSRTKPSRVSDERAEDHGHLTPLCASSGGRDRTHVVTGNNRAPIHSATPESRASTDGAGIEPADRLAPAYAVAGRCIPSLPPIPFPTSGSGATRTPKRWPSYLFSRQAPDPAGSLPRRADLQVGSEGNDPPTSRLRAGRSAS